MQDVNININRFNDVITLRDTDDASLVLSLSHQNSDKEYGCVFLSIFEAMQLRDSLNQYIEEHKEHIDIDDVKQKAIFMQ